MEGRKCDKDRKGPYLVTSEYLSIADYTDVSCQIQLISGGVGQETEVIQTSIVHIDQTALVRITASKSLTPQ